jgi:hypothetical protein
MALVAVLLVSGCGDVVTSRYETYDRAAEEGWFARGWLPGGIPASSFAIKTSEVRETYTLPLPEFDAVLHLGADERFAHFLKRVADWETVWGLRDDAGWVAAADSHGNSSFPVWPHPRYALACADNEWAGNAPAAIDVHEFVEEWLPAMASDAVSLAVFPTPGLRGVIVSAGELAAALRQALAEYE